VPGMGGNIGELRGEAAAYRAQVRNILGQLTADLGDSWDDADSGKPSAFYDRTASLVVGPVEAFEGRAEIRKAFEARLRKMRGMTFTIQGFDMSDQIAFIRGTMSYELLSADAAPVREIAGFTMILRLRRADWFIQSHTIAGTPILPP
jgi:ketosteroid isomerase-like protein